MKQRTTKLTRAKWAIIKYSHTILAVVSILGIGAVSLYFLYLEFSAQEDNNFENEYSALTLGLATQMVNVISHTRLGAAQISRIYEITQPNRSVWPNVYLNLEDSLHIFQPTLDITNINPLFCPLVKESEVESFESFAAEMYAADPLLPANVGVSPFGFGIFALNFSTTPATRYHDITGENAFSPYRLIVPNLQNTAQSSNRRQYLKNIHSEELQSNAVDSVYECALNGSTACESITELFIPSFGVQSPVSYTSLYFSGIFVENELVGLTSFLLYWIPMIIAGVPAEQLRDVQFTISTPQTSFSVQVYDGIGHEVKHINHKDRKKSISLSTGSENVQYSLDMYPTDEFYDDRHTLTPLITCLLLGLVLVLLLFLGMLYFSIFQMRVDRDAGKRLDSAKRSFMRVLSHEVRTPLQSISLGLSLQRSQLGLQPRPDSAAAGNDESKKSLLEGERSLTGVMPAREVEELQTELEMNASLAASILDDLIDYDHILVSDSSDKSIDAYIIPMIMDEMRPAKRQAARAQCQLSFAIESPNDTQTPTANHKIIPNARLTSSVAPSISSANDVVVHADIEKMQRVFHHVLNNALKFTPAGCSIEVTLTWRLAGDPFCQAHPKAVHPVPRDLREGSVLFSVKAFGSSVDPYYENFLCNHDVTFNPEELQVGQGSGIGLWVSQRITEIHGGALWMCANHDTIPSYTIFVEIPLVLSSKLGVSDFPSFSTQSSEHRDKILMVATPEVEESDVEARPGSHTEGDAPPPPHPGNARQLVNIKGRPLKIMPNLTESLDEKKEPSPPVLRKVMVVDDAPAIRKLLTRVLTKKGAIVTAACDGKQCVELIEAEGAEYGCILMDYEMPVMNGPDATKKIREMGFSSQRLLIVGVTGNTMFKDVEYFRQCGVDEVYSKPVDTSVIVDLLVSAGCIIADDQSQQGQ
jgi:signal transduction histidine kinase/ActR/RegA family two-component response regulator